MISLRNVHKAFDDLTVLDGVDFEVKEGETVALLGASGVGKSVLLKHINGLIDPDSGDVMVDGENVAALQREALARLRRKVGYVFQYGALFDSETVFDNVLLGITDEDEMKDVSYAGIRVIECLELVNLEPSVARKYPAEISGGMKKRVGIARAIAGSPTYLLYDEPTSGLDPVNADIIDSLVEKLQGELGVTSVMVTHDVRGAFGVANRIALLKGGKIRAMGTAEELSSSDDEAVREFLERDRKSVIKS